jgi:hypothetical protein
MTWLASTFHDQLSAGTELAVFEEPWDPQVVVPRQLPASVELNIDFLDGETKIVWVREVFGSEAVIQTSDQTQWRMVLVDSKDLRYPVPPSEDASCTYWRVREQIAE